MVCPLAVERLVPELGSRGLIVSLIKLSHKNIDIDRPSKDSYRSRDSGCKEELLLGNDRWALMHELRGQEVPELDYLLERMQDCDSLLIEGFKNGVFPNTGSLARKCGNAHALGELAWYAGNCQ